MREPRPLVRLVLSCARRPGPVLLLALLLAVVSGWLSVTRLGVTTDLNGLFKASLPWKQREAELKAMFPQFDKLVVAVVDGESPEVAEATAAGLLAALQADRAHFLDARRPDASPFFEEEGLLFLEKAQLSAMLDQTIDAQPFLGQLVADPSLRGLCAALSLLGMGVERGQADLGAFAAALRGFDAALRAAAEGRAKPLSWQTLLAGPLAALGGPYRLVLAHPRLDYSALQPGAAATAALRQAASQLEFVRSGAAHVRVTGAVALSDEEFATVAEGAVAGLVGSFLLVVLWLVLAVRSWRLILPIVATLLLGLLLTTGFAAVTSSPLNLISVAFAILFVGIAVDFAIQFSVRFRGLLREHRDVPAALAATADRAGGQVAVAAAATAAGFLAFVPTDFSGVAELGLIAGAGMLIAFLCTMTVLPAAIAVMHPRPGLAEAGFAWAAPLDRGAVRFRWPIVGLFALLAACGAALLPRLVFDSDPLHVKDPNTEAMRTLADLAAVPLTNPYTIDIIAADGPAAADIVRRVSALPLVAQVISLASLVPQEQGEKLALLADANSLLTASLAPPTPGAPITAADLRLAVSTAQRQIERALPKLPPGHALGAIAEDLRALSGAPDAVLLAANAALTRFLPQQLARLRRGLAAHPVTAAGIPPDLARDWVLPDGRMRVQVTARPATAGDPAGLRRFVEQVRTVVPEAGGSAVAVAETAVTVIAAFQHAALGALAAIVVILVLALRRALDVALVLLPLLLSSLLTVLLAVLLPLPLNFANIIALPLLLGVGVSFNIYFVMNWRAGLRSQLQSPTARAVVFSALTTGTAFGSLALSRHPGTASMGLLLLLSLGCTLLASLVFVPAMLAILSSHRAGITVSSRG